MLMLHVLYIDYNDCDLLKYRLAVSQNMCIIYAIETDI